MVTTVDTFPTSELRMPDFAGVADAFDEIVADNMRWVSSGFTAARQNTLRKHGRGALYGGVWVGTHGAELTLAIVQGAGAGVVDLLRLGETFREPSLGAFGSDVLRVVSLVPAGRMEKFGRVLLLRRANAVIGGPMSCAVTSSLKAALLSGRNLLTPWFVSMRRLMPGLNPWTALLSSKFPGVYMSHVVNAAAKMGIPFKIVGNGGTLADIAAHAAKVGEPIVFRINWIGTASAPGGAHIMTAYLGPKGVRFMDQFGDAWRLNANGALINTVPSHLGKTMKVTQFQPGQIASLGMRYVVPEARTVAALRHIDSAVDASRALQIGMPAAGAIDGLYTPIYWVHPNIARYTEAIVRKHTGRPSALYPWERRAPAPPNPPGQKQGPARMPRPADYFEPLGPSS